MRHSELSLVIIRLKVKIEPYLVLIRHPKWLDWTLPGGHVEENEANDWARAAIRECQEELAPLKFREDFILLPLLDRPVKWGPIPSKSANNEPTTYAAQLFALRFLKEPSDCLHRLPRDEFQIARQSEVPKSDLLTVAHDALGGFDRAPLSWDSALSSLPQFRSA